MVRYGVRGYKVSRNVARKRGMSMIDLDWAFQRQPHEPAEAFDELRDDGMPASASWVVLTLHN